MKVYEFDAVMKTDGTSDWGYVEFPFDVEKEFRTRGRLRLLLRSMDTSIGDLSKNGTQLSLYRFNQES